MMSSLEQNILLPEENNTIILLAQMGPARYNMAVVEPAMVPIPPEPPDMLAPQDEIRNEPDNIDIDTNVINDSTNELNQPMIDVEISVEAEELQYSAELDTGSIDQKLVFNHTN
jgi:hypothetical protein